MNKDEAIERIGMINLELTKMIKENSVDDSDWTPFVERMEKEFPEAVTILRHDHEKKLLTKIFNMTDKDLEVANEKAISAGETGRRHSL